MAHTTLSMSNITAALDEAGIRSKALGSEKVGLSFWGMETYRDTDGDAHGAVVVDVGSDRLRLYMPRAWQVPSGNHRAAVLETCLRLQWRYYGIRFEFDHLNGELQAAYHFHPHAMPTASQVPELVRLLLRLVERAHPAIEAAINDGTVYEPDAAASTTPDASELMALLESLGPDQLTQLMDAVREAVSK